jgi:F-type H+-transporting ATPase subunit epsilon
MLLEIITPEKTILKEEVDEILAPTEKGQIGILPHHINLVTKLTAGELIMENKGKEKVYAITGGFLQVHNNIVTILADYAAHSEEIDVDKAIAAQKHAQEIIKKGKEKVSERDFALAESELRKSLLNINVAKRRKRRTDVI